MAVLDLAAKKELIKSVPFWFHSIDFGDGLRAEGRTPVEVHEVLASAIPKNLKGMSVLDVGAWDGYYSFLCERRGAKVTAVDQQHPLNTGFRVAKEVLGSSVEFHHMELSDLPKLQKQFDLVLVFGILYHVKEPLASLEVIRKMVPNGRLILETDYYVGDEVSLMRFWPGKELNNDPTNWWSPNISCILDLLEAAGFSESQIFGRFNEHPEGGRVIVKAYP